MENLSASVQKIGLNTQIEICPALPTKYRIKQDMAASYSTHQNDTAARGWWTFYYMGRCLLLYSNLPDKQWHHIVQTAAYQRNMCLSGQRQH